MPNGSLETKTWTSQEFEAYVEYLNTWPLFNYALENLTAHLKGGDGGQNESVPTLVKRLSDHQCSSYLGVWIDSHLRLTLPSHSQPQGHWSIYRDITRAVRSRDGTIDKTRDTLDDFKYEALQAAAKAGFSQVARALLTTCPKIDNRVQGKTPLIISAGKGHEATVGLLLEIGMDTEARDTAGQSALHHAAKNEHTETLRLLLERGAKKDARDNKGQTALGLAILKWYV
jgi:hypothetical protein